jgi:Tol biopolymer transport system component
VLQNVLLATFLVFATTPVLYAKERILLYRIGPSQSTLFIANADGSDERPLLPNSGFDYNASFSADGKWIIFTSERGGSADIYRVHPDGSSLERLTDDPAYDDQGALSPDGKQLAFVSSRGTGSADIWVLDLQTKKVRNLTRAPCNFRPSWSPDGKWIAFSSDRNTPVRRDGERFEQSHAVSIYLMRTDGADVRRITSAGKFAGSPKWSPDGERIVFYEMDIQDTFYARLSPGRAKVGKLVDSQIVSVDVATGTRQEHTSGPGLKVSPQILSANRIGYVMKAGSRTGLAFTTGDQGANGQMRNPTWSPDGKRVVYQKWSSESWRQNQPLFSIDPEFDLAFSNPFPAFSHDGKKLAVTKSGSNISVSVMDGDGTNPKLIFRADEGAVALAPEWSPKDDWIAFGSGSYFLPRGRSARVMMMHPDGSELHELVKTAGNSGFPSWSPDGKRIVFRFWGGSEYGLRIINLDDGSVTNLTTGFDNFPAWSPKGDLIAFTRFDEDNYDIYTIRPDGTDLRRLTTAPGNNAHEIWSPDGKQILFSSARLGFKDEAPLSDDIPQPYGELFVMNADGSKQRPLTDNQWEDATPAWAPVSLP